MINSESAGRDFETSTIPVTGFQLLGDIYIFEV